MAVHHPLALSERVMGPCGAYPLSGAEESSGAVSGAGVNRRRGGERRRGRMARPGRRANRAAAGRRRCRRRRRGDLHEGRRATTAFRFERVTIDAEGGGQLTSDVAAGDLDGDGLPDLIGHEENTQVIGQNGASSPGGTRPAAYPFTRAPGRGKGDGYD